MSILNGKVEAPYSMDFDTYEGAQAFIHSLEAGEFEGIQVRDGRYIVNFTTINGDMEDHSEAVDECGICGRTEYMCPGH